MKLYTKVKWVLGILMIFILIIATNLIDRNNFVRIKDSLETIYEDRLVAKDLIFKISKSVQEKELALAKLDSTFYLGRNKQVNVDIEKAINTFEGTKLTKKEAKVFNDFKNNLAVLIESENSTPFEKSSYNSKILNVKENLYALSEIQMNEGKRQMSISKRAIDSIELFTQLEIYVLIFLGVVVQVIVIYKPKEK
ncbi:MCP four helix bundle domain-containing protein [Polaribacter sp. R2A056_3_33]|uniref:MCP four helix bundle domain-containing protein n=1 Tax=Polaribacter sp. R2A056_3_33 TaxID=2745563 RepID=UPI001C4F7C4B|nr:MCP four helix bundle domain-containing protein [Polaribacter sp. R2A056_3_33]QXP70458.1 MCP four helix bundle domain-containing protein [Polaribacter sp. R2A056_3_33]